MRFKTVPEPPTDDTDDADDGIACDEDVGNDGDANVLERARRAIPLVPASEAECCARLLDRLSLPARDAAREWLTFLRAFGLAVETNAGFRRRRETPACEALATAFRERVYGVREVLTILDEATEPLSAHVVTERFAEHVPQWERYRYPDPEAIWGERVDRILGWAVWFGLVERVGSGYVLID